MNNIRFGALIICLLLLAACSSQQVYNAVQQNRLQDCQNGPPQLYEDCIERHSVSYEDYERGRQEAVN